MVISKDLKEFKSLGSSNQETEVPNLVQVLHNSFDWFTKQGIEELLKEVSPVEDFSGGRFELKFLNHEIKKPLEYWCPVDETTLEKTQIKNGLCENCKTKIIERVDSDAMMEHERECRKQEITFSYPVYITVQLIVRETGEVKEQTLFFGDLPMMTSTGTFIINGAERVVISQLVRSPGGYFTTETDPNTGRNLCLGKVIPNRGAWIELETSPRNVLYVKIDRKRKAPVTMLLRSLDWTNDSRIKSSEISDDEIIKLFSNVDENRDFNFIKSTLAKDSTSETYRNERNEKDALQRKNDAQIEIYRRQRPGEPPSVENASKLLNDLFFDEKRYDLGKVGRHRLNKVLRVSNKTQLLSNNDFVELVRRMIMINNGQAKVDDIDHLGIRRVRAVGELIQNQIRSGFIRMERVIKERMSTQLDPMVTTPAALINIRPIVAAIREFFGGSQLSQFMDQTNPLSELTHKRRLSALGPGGLSRERAGFDVRDVHHSHYGRICPIETPEGPNIGLLGSLSTYASINEFGFIETPYRKVKNEILSTDPDILGRTPLEDLKNSSGKVIAIKNKPINNNNISEVLTLPSKKITVLPYVTTNSEDIIHLSADEEEKYHIGQATTNLDVKGQISNDSVEVRFGGESYFHVPPDQVDLMDISPMQIVSVSTALIPFLEHDDANRALMGSNMQRQAVPLIKPQAPLVGTGMERRVAEDSGQLLLAKVNGIVSEMKGNEIEITDKDGVKHIHPLSKFVRSNQTTCISQRPLVEKGIFVKQGQPIADSSSTDQGELALGQNLRVGFMSFDGYNYEDAIILNEDLVKNDRYTSIHIEKHDLEARDTKLGPEEITRDIPNVGEESLSDLDEFGIVRVGAWVTAGDILVGKVTPKGETELSAEEKLLRAIFGEKARDVKDSSLRVPHGDQGKVIETRILTKEDGDNLPPGVMKMVRVWIAHTRKISQGDKMAGRHGNKGVVAKILPREDMPFTDDGTPLDVILNPIGVPSRMNLGQLLETHLGGAAETLGFHARTSVFNNPKDGSIEDQMARAWIVEQSGSLDKKNLDSLEINWDKVENWLSEKGFNQNKIWSDAQTNRGVARDACLQIWLKDTTNIETNKLKPSELMQLALKTAREKHISAPIFGKQTVYDGRTGDAYDQPVTVGNVYMLKLIHLVEDKIHARSTGPYSLITQQPLGGKAQFGGQRFGEMEVWALEAYSAAHTLQEILTIKSDDTLGRVKTYESIVKGEPIIQPGIPESFHVLMKEIQGLGLSMELMSEEDPEITVEEKDDTLLNVGINWDEVSNEDELNILDLEELDTDLIDEEEEDDEDIDDEDIDDEEEDDEDIDDEEEDDEQELEVSLENLSEQELNSDSEELEEN